MPELREILDEVQLQQLRAAYDPAVMRAAMLEAIGRTYPPLDEWNRAIAATFYGDDGPIAPRDRERCLIALLTQSGPELSLAIHCYWGLMEGLTVPEVSHTIGLAASYAGVPRLAFGLPLLERVLTRLAAIEPTGGYGSARILRLLLESTLVRPPE
jgi:alkylhydroperoxidase/carboxymuconolactone decarboxylase family protein YurZ